MASNSPESPTKKRKQPINGLKRDQPLFANRRPQRTLQQPPEFLTDSLNTSYIPSPSPQKSPTRQDGRAKPRQALANGRSLAAALNATVNTNDENEPPTSTPSSDLRRSKQHLRPRPAPTARRATAPFPSEHLRSPSGTKTPSHPPLLRGRTTSITSTANSESSPPRGYAEAYQRIDEEESLAQEDSIHDTEGMGGYDLNQQERPYERDRSRLQRLQHSASPMSLKASRRASPRGVVEDNIPAEDRMDDQQTTAHESDSESGVDYTENVTDTSMDSGSSQYAKDLQRLGALKSGTKVFSKARMGDRVTHSVENLLRRNNSNESLQSAVSAGSLSTRNSDPSINIPKTWGRKAKPGKDWLARINSRSGRFTGDVPKRHSSGDQMIAENQRREWAEPIDQWIASASEIPLPSSEDRRSSQSGASSQGSTPTTAMPRSNSLGRRRQWEMNDEDFTGRSLQVSESPPIRVRNATLDSIREREIQNLERRAVTTSRLGELREKSSGESLRRVKSNKSIEEPIQEDEEPSKEPAQNEQSPTKNTQVQEEPQKSDQSMQDEGEAIPDTPIVIYRSNSHSQSNPSEARDKRASHDKSPSSRPNHERKDSHDILKRLARVTSESPSPPKTHADIVHQKPSQPRNKPEEPVEQTPQPPKPPPNNIKTPIVTGAWVDQTINDKTPKPSKPNDSLKTPLITGAWIDTPLPTGGRGPPMPTPSDQEEQKELHPEKLGAAELIHRLKPGSITPRPQLSTRSPLKYTGPPLPKSALEEILSDAKTGKGGKVPVVKIEGGIGEGGEDSEDDPTLHLGESTIASLEDLIANDESYSTLLAPTPPSLAETPSGPSSSDPSPQSSQALTTSTRSSRRLTDPQSYTHLLSRLTTLAPSLRASKRQIEGLERAVATVPTQRGLKSRGEGEEEECNEGGELHDFLFPCQRCGCPGTPYPSTSLSALAPRLNILTTTANDSITTLTLPIPRLWYWPHDSWRPKLTWLGLALLLAYVSYCVEDYARWRYCHPLYAYRMVGYGTGRGAPKPPFVAVKVLWRWVTGGAVGGAVYGFLRVAVKIFSSLLGWLIGFFFGDDGASGSGKKGGQLGSKDARIPKPSWGPDLRMMDDEVL